VRIFAALGFASRGGQNAGGVARSLDRGVTWEVISDGFGVGKTPVSSVKIRTALGIPIVFALTYGRAAWTALEPLCEQVNGE